MKKNKQVEIYFRDVRRTFPVYHAREKEYFNQFKECVYDYVESHNELDSDKITREFGTPAEVVSTYLSNVDNDYLMHNIKSSHIIKRTALVVCVALLAMIGYRIYRLDKAIKKAESQIVTTVEETIEETTEVVIDGEIFDD